MSTIESRISPSSRSWAHRLFSEPLDVESVPRGVVFDGAKELSAARDAARTDKIGALANDVGIADRASFGHLEGRRAFAVGPLVDPLHDIGNDIAGASHPHLVSRSDVLVAHLVVVV